MESSIVIVGVHASPQPTAKKPLDIVGWAERSDAQHNRFSIHKHRRIFPRLHRCFIRRIINHWRWGSLHSPQPTGYLQLAFLGVCINKNKEL